MKREADVDTLDTYLSGEYIRDQADANRLLELGMQAEKTLLGDSAFNGDVWRYELEDRPEPTPGKPSQAGQLKVSHSTTAMIAFALDVATGRILLSPLVPAVAVRGQSVNGPEIDRAKDPRDRIQEALNALVADATSGSKFQTQSSTFGVNDPFTLTWLVGLGETRLETAWGPLLDTAIGELQRVFSKKGARAASRRQSILTLNGGKTGAHEVPHAFPTVRFVHLYRALRFLKASRQTTGKGTGLVARLQDADTESLRNALRDRVHVHLSLSALPGSAFDPADMVLALEGFQLLGSPNIPLVRRVLEVLASRQETSEYWRPLLPFTATEKGVVLLPQSTEVANSLLRICDGLYRTEPTLFSEYLPLFRRYASWLESRAHRMPDRLRVGWESEHTYNTDRIHLWQTSQALLFLRSYIAMLQRHMADASLRAAGLVATTPLAAKSELGTDAEAKESRARSGYDARQLIARDVIPPDALVHSLILSGPPGTGKTVLADDIASRRNYRRITITTSDFAAAGQEGIEARAKAIFRTLGLQANVVVLFDEIDQLLLDRESKEYGRQADVFKLMTPGMLTKINDLVKNGDNIYVLATNYLDRIDPAITRPGRFDGQYVVLPPGWDERVNHVLKVFGLTRSGDRLREHLRDVLKMAGLHTYRDLEQTAKRVAKHHPKTKNGNVSERGLAAKFCDELDLVRKLIELGSYQARCEGQADPEEAAAGTARRCEEDDDSSSPKRARELAQIEAALVASVLFEPLVAEHAPSQNKGQREREQGSARDWEEWNWLKAAITKAANNERPVIRETCQPLLQALLANDLSLIRTYVAP
jgi:hypothetical protein